MDMDGLQDLGRLRELGSQELKISDDTFVFLFVGQHTWEKNHAFLIEAMAQLRQKGRSFKLVFVGDGLTDMDAVQVDIQVLSLTALGVESLDPELGEPLAQSTNNALAEIIWKHPERFSCYATIAPKRREQAALELERAVKELGLKGWKTHSN